MNFEYDVAVSFAGEDRHVVEPVATALVERGLRVFYDKYEEANLWGKDLFQHLDDIYRKRARYCVIFASEAYARKIWTRHELKSAQARAIQENEEYILPARLDDTDIPGIRPTIGYIDVRARQAGEIADLIQAKLQQRPSTTAEMNSPRSDVSDITVLRRELAELRAAYADRTLSPGALATIEGALATLPPEKIGVLVPQADEEAQQFGGLLAEVFRRANWPVEFQMAIHPATVLGLEVVGVQVLAIRTLRYPR